MRYSPFDNSNNSGPLSPSPTYKNVQDQIHHQIIKNLTKIDSWYQGMRNSMTVPIYASFDIRDSGFKVAPVDANIYPAGFNNICQVDRENAHELVARYLKDSYTQKIKKILLLAEEHTKNLFYWENVIELTQILKGPQLEVRVAVPGDFGPREITSASGRTLTLFSASRQGDQLEVQDFAPDLVISNNDFSEAYEKWGSGLSIPINPPRQLGWYRRRKSTFFSLYNNLIQEFSNLVEIDPWILQVDTEVFVDFDVNSDQSRDRLSKQAETVLHRMRNDYQQRGIKQDPFVFVKNNSGTYGLAVMQVESADEIRSWNYHIRKKMRAAKGGRSVTEVIIQEGIPSAKLVDEQVAEPVVYTIGFDLAGGFLRAHSQKGPHESLNAPGAVYRRLCVSDLKINVEGCPMENVYGWVARLSQLAIGMELKSLKV